MFLSCDSDILTALTSLGEEYPSPAMLSHLERFVCMLYRTKVYTKVNELRWFLYSNRSAEGESLPTTIGSLTPHVRRAHYIVVIWIKASESHPCLPYPTEFGWTLDATTKRFDPVRCLHPPASEAMMKLVKCGCKKECTGNCSCRNNKIPCTELYSCLSYIAATTNQ